MTVEKISTIEGNMMIAEFMDAEKHFGKSDGHGRWKHWFIKEHGYFDTGGLQYHFNWSWLMPVCIKLGMIVVDSDIAKTYQDVIKRIMESNNKL